MVSVWYSRTADSDMQPEKPTVRYHTSGEKGWKCLSSFLNNSCPEAGGLRRPVVLSLLVSLIHSYWIFHGASPCEITLWFPRILVLFQQSQVFTLSTQAISLLQVTQALTQVLIQITLIPITYRHFSCNLNRDSLFFKPYSQFGLWLCSTCMLNLGKFTHFHLSDLICMQNCFFVRIPAWFSK